jgi:orotidine-5'-phosphate decarboxylase
VQKPLQQVGAKATAPRSIFGNKLAIWKDPAQDKPDGVAKKTADKLLQFQNRVSDAGTDAMTCSLADLERINNQLKIVIHGIISN